MASRFQEPIFALILILASGIPFTAYMLGVLLEPVTSILVGGVLVGLGVAVAVPEGARIISSIVALLAVGVAGVGVPRLVATVSTPLDEMGAALALSGIVLLFTITTLRLTVFRAGSLGTTSQ